MRRVPNGARVLAAGFALALALAAGAALAATGREGRAGFELLARYDPGQPYTGDVWGHRDHAYLSSYGRRGTCLSLGVRVLSLRDLRRPRLVSRFADAASQPRLAGTWTEKTIVQRVRTPWFTGDLAVTSVQACEADGFTGFALYDVTNPARPRELALVRTEPRGSHEIWLQPVAARGRAYVWTAIPGSERQSSPDGQRPGAPDFRIFDVSRPEAPRQVGEWGAWKELGLRPDVDERFVDWHLVHSVTGNPAGTRAYLSYWDLGTVILDVANPARPRYLGRTAAPGAGRNAHSAWLGRGGRLLVETHETPGGRPVLYDIRNARQPVRLSEFALPPAVLARGRRDHLTAVGGLELDDSVHDPKVRGTVAFFSWYRQGLVAVDVANPRRPRFLARFLPPPSRDRDGFLCPDSACTAMWGVHVADRYVLASDILGGLWVLRFRR